MNPFIRTLCLHTALAALSIASTIALGQNKSNSGMTTVVPGALPNIHLVSPVADGQWTMPAGDYGNTRYSPLDQINTTNVHSLHVVGETEPADEELPNPEQYTSTSPGTSIFIAAGNNKKNPVSNMGGNK